jgi:hypothetical protein
MTTMLLGGNDARRAGFQSSLLDDSWHIRAGKRDWSYRRRGDSQFGARNKYITLWPASGFMSGDRSSGFCLFGQDCAEFDAWSPSQRASRGNGQTKFIMGQCKDSGGSGVSGATVQCFLTATDALVSEITADTYGNYEAPTVYPGAAHYLVAYRAGSPDITGATVNTLTPTNRDGT